MSNEALKDYLLSITQFTPEDAYEAYKVACTYLGTLEFLKWVNFQPNT